MVGAMATTFFVWESFESARLPRLNKRTHCPQDRCRLQRKNKAAKDRKVSPEFQRMLGCQHQLSMYIAPSLQNPRRGDTPRSPLLGSPKRPAYKDQT